VKKPEEQRYFAGIPCDTAGRDRAPVWLQSIPYDGTSTWGKGADQGYERFMDALDNMEIYDIETDSEPYRSGVHILPALTENRSPEAVFEAVYANTRELLKSGRTLTFFGGEHSISIGVIKAHYEHYENLTVLQLDAHADLRPEYLGSAYNHACALHDASRNARLLQVGIRSMDSTEKDFLRPERCWFAQDIQGRDSWMEESIAEMTEKVYITVDLDVFDPSIMPSTGTPEPGGMDWYTVIRYLKKVFSSRSVVGWDIVELAPIEGLRGPDFLAAKLYYKMLSYKMAFGQ